MSLVKRLKFRPTPSPHFARLFRRYRHRLRDWSLKREPRERVLVAVAAFTLVALVWHGQFFSSASTRLSTLNADIGRLASENDQLETSLKELEQQRAEAQDPDEALEEAIVSFEADIAALEQALRDAGIDFIAMVPMRDAMSALQNELVNPAAPRITRFDQSPGAGLDSADGAIDIEQRQISLVFEANFHQTLDFLSILEESEVPLVWRSLSYQVTEYPVAAVSLEFDLYAPAHLD